jgi:hypothetical protein
MNPPTWLDDLRLQSACARGGASPADADRAVQRARAHLAFAELLRVVMREQDLALALVGGEVAVVVAKSRHN